MTRLVGLAVTALALGHGLARALRDVLLLGAALLLVGCPKLPPVSGCTPTAQSCRDGIPHVCSASQRWEPAGEVSCSRVGGVCVVGDAGVAHCAPIVDRGAQ